MSKRPLNFYRPRYAFKYNLSPAAYSQMLENQKHRCAICRRKKALVVDHCHKTYVVRGLLCHGCNTGLGKFKDSVKGLAAAREYLMRVKPQSGRNDLYERLRRMASELMADAMRVEALPFPVPFKHKIVIEYNGKRFVATQDRTRVPTPWSLPLLLWKAVSGESMDDMSVPEEFLEMCEESEAEDKLEIVLETHVNVGEETQ